MKLFRNLIVVMSLVAFLFFGAAASANASIGAPDPVTEGIATEVARAWIVACSSTFPSWVGATVGAPVTYYSHDGLKSVYEFTVHKGGTDVGYIMVAARKDWGPILEFGTGSPPSKNLSVAMKKAASEGYLTSGETPAPVYYYDGADTAAVQLGDRMKSANVLISLLYSQVVPKHDSTKLQIAAAAAQAEWSSLVDQLPGVGELDVRRDHLDHPSVLTIPNLVAKDVPDLVPHYAQGVGYGDSGPDPAATYPSCVGSSPDYWDRWDGCSPTAGAAILGYWMSRGYTNFDCGGNPQDTQDALIDLCHIEMLTRDDTDKGVGYTPDGPIRELQPYARDGIRNVAALWEEPFYFGYDFAVDGKFPYFARIKTEIDAGRPFVLNYMADKHSVACVGYAEVLGDDPLADPYAIDGVRLYLHVYDGWDEEESHYILRGDWGAVGFGACMTTVIPQNRLTLDKVGDGDVKVEKNGSPTDTGSEKYDFGTELTLTAIPDPGWYFTGWTWDGDALSHPSWLKQTITMNSDYTMVAHFDKKIIAPRFHIAKLPDNGYSGNAPQISGDRVVWQGYDGSDFEVFTWTPTDGTAQVTNNGLNESYPEVSGDRVVWEAYDGHDREVFTWTPSGGIVQLTDNSVDDRYPQVSGDRVVWDHRVSGTSYEIFTWTPTENTTQITSDGHNWGANVSGNRVVWDHGSGADGEIFTWTPPDSGVPADGIVQITDNDYADGDASVSGDRIVWSSYVGSQRQVFTWTPPASGVPADGIAQITSSGGVVGALVSGDRIVWDAYDETDSEIFTWTPPASGIPADGIVQITDNDYYDYVPEVSGDRVVWQAFLEAGPIDVMTTEATSSSATTWQDEGQGTEIFTWTPPASGIPTDGILRITDNDYNDYTPEVFDDRLVWEASDWDSAGIYTAVFESAELDSDGDGLPDVWEETGDLDGDDQMELDLPAMGADPMHKDIFVEIDWMKCDPDDSPPWLPVVPGDIYALNPNPLALNWVVQAFASAPVTNPDGTAGINLHIDAGRDSQMKPDGETWEDLSRSSAVRGVPNFVGGSDGVFSWMAFENIKKTNFDAARRAVFHYCVYASSGGPGSSTGVSRGHGASDFIVSAGSGTSRLTPQQEAGTFMHELGHNLGLGDGGGDAVKYKPNYLSVMNYAFQLTGLLTSGIPSGEAFPGRTGLLDYSRNALDPLNENSLDEPSGLTPVSALCGLGDTRLGTRWWLGSNLLEHTWLYDGVVDAIDWDGNGEYTSDVSRDLNRDDYFGSLAGYDDWASITFRGGSIGDAGAPLPDTTPNDEISYQEFVDRGIDHGPYAVRLDGYLEMRVFPGWQGTLPVSIENFGDLADTYDLEVTFSCALFDTTAVPQELTLQPGESLELGIGLCAPTTQADGELGTVEVVVRSRNDDHNFGVCRWTIACLKPTLDDSVDVLREVAADLRSRAEEIPLVSSTLVSATAAVDLAESAEDPVSAVTALHAALILLWQAIDALEQADEQSGTPTYARAIEELKIDSGLLVTDAGNETEWLIYAIPDALVGPTALAAARAHLAAGSEAFAQGDHLAAVAQYLEAVSANLAPDVEIDPPVAVSEGSVFAGSGSFTDADSTSWTATVDYGDGSGTESLSLNSNSTFPLTHTYTDNGTYTLSVAVTDNSGGTGSATSAVTVDNVTPALGSIALPTESQALNATVAASASFTDLGTLDAHLASWDWGDGSSSSGTVTESQGSGSVEGSHAYTRPGLYTVTLTVTDKDGASTTASAAEEVKVLGVVLYSGTSATLSGSYTVGSPLLSGQPSAGVYVNGSLTTNGSVDLSRATVYVGAQGATVPALSQFMPDALVTSLVAASQVAQPTGITYDGLSYGGNGSVTFTTPITVNGNLTISGSGTYTFDSVYVTGNVSVSASATVSFASLWVGGTLSLSGSGSRTFGPTYVAGNTTFSGSGRVKGSLIVTAGALGITGGVTIGGDGVGTNPSPVRLLVIGEGRAVTYSGSGAFYGQLYNQFGSFTQTGSNIIHGSVLCGGSYTASGSCAIEYDQEVLDCLD